MATESVACPCTQDCPDRAVHCRINCTRGYDKYEAFKRQQYADRAAEIAAYDAFKAVRYRNVRRKLVTAQEIIYRTCAKRAEGVQNRYFKTFS